MEEMYLETVDRSTEIVLDMKHNVHLSSPQPKGFSHGLHAGNRRARCHRSTGSWEHPGRTAFTSQQALGAAEIPALATLLWSCYLT